MGEFRYIPALVFGIGTAGLFERIVNTNDWTEMFVGIAGVAIGAYITEHFLIGKAPKLAEFSGKAIAYPLVVLALTVFIRSCTQYS